MQWIEKGGLQMRNIETEVTVEIKRCKHGGNTGIRMSHPGGDQFPVTAMRVTAVSHTVTPLKR